MSSGKSGKRHGYTTGACAAAAAKAAARMLLTGQSLEQIELQWRPYPDQSVSVTFPLEDVTVKADVVCCAVRKDAGEDIDVTDGMLIYAKVSRLPEKASPEEITEAEDHGMILISGPSGPDQKPVQNNPENRISTGQADDSVPFFTLSDLADDNGVIPMRWDQAAAFLSPEGKSQKSEKNLITLSGESQLDAGSWPIFRKLFPGDAEIDRNCDTHVDLVTGTPDRQEAERFVITGGEGIGTVTKPGLDQPPGEPAINSGPRRMIRDAVASVCEACEDEGRLQIEISAPGGQETAEKTFNPRLGIQGGISILGSTGIVEPMSGRAVAETVRTEVRVKAADSTFLALVPGNTGAAFVRQELLIPEAQTVIVSNYPGEALDEAKKAGVQKVLLAGSLGKLIKLAGGIFYTHSRDADARIDILMRCAVQAGASSALLRQLDGCVTTEAGLDLLDQNGLLDLTADVILERALAHTQRRADGPRIEMIFLRNSGEVLMFTDGAFTVAGEKENE